GRHGEDGGAGPEGRGGLDDQDVARPRVAGPAPGIAPPSDRDGRGALRWRTPPPPNAGVGFARRGAAAGIGSRGQREATASRRTKEESDENDARKRVGDGPGAGDEPERLGPYERGRREHA